MDSWNFRVFIPQNQRFDFSPLSGRRDRPYLKEMPTCSSGGTYRFLGRVPDATPSYIECDQEMHVLDLKRLGAGTAAELVRLEDLIRRSFLGFDLDEPFL